MSKHRQKHTRPNIAPAALLRARLEALWRDPAAAHQSAEQIEAGLQTVVTGHKAESVINSVLSVFSTTRPEVQATVEDALPAWLARQNYVDTLESLLGSRQLPADMQPIARRWLAATGRDISGVPTGSETSFHSAYEFDDGSQAAVCVLWYSNPQRNRVRGFQFLLDYNPPWDGSIKDAFLLPDKPPRTLIRRYVETWEARGQAMTPMEGPEVKRKLLRALLSNRSANIRLPELLILFREQFFGHVLSLPDLPDTPSVTIDEFHTLSQAGQSAESLSHFEQTVGRRIRMEDGKELFIDASLANLAFDEFDGDED